MKNKISYSLLTASIAAMAFIPMALAAPIFSDNIYQKCDEAVYPYISGATSQQISYSNADLNHSSENECQNHLIPSFQGASFPNVQHVQPVDSVSHPNIVTTERSVPVAHHEHHYVNESVDNDGFYKRAWLRTFEIKLQPDLKAALLQGSLKCPIPSDGINPLDNGFASCNHTNPNVFGGTSVNFDGTTIKYTFGLNQPQNGYKPIIPGNNAAIDQGIFFPADTTKAENRLFGMTLVFTTKDRTLENPSKTIWSATTTSRAEVIHTAIPKTAFDSVPAGLTNTEDNKGKYHACNEGGVWNTSNSWCNYGGYEWVDIGSDISIWKAETTPPPSSYCTGLEITSPNMKKIGVNTYEFTPDTDATFNVLPSFSNGEVPLDYRWNADENQVDWTFTPSLPPEAEIMEEPEFPTFPDNTGDTDNKVEVNLANSLFTALPLASQISVSDSASGTVSGISGAGQIPYNNYGLFYDSQTDRYTNPSSGRNPYVDTNNPGFLPFPLNEDKSTYYTGGPEDTLIIVQGIDPDAADPYAPEAYVGNNCQAKIIIPPQEDTNTCVDLTITPDSTDPFNPTTFTVTPEFKDQSNPIPLDYYWTADDESPFPKFQFGGNKVEVSPGGVSNMTPVGGNKSTINTDDLLPDNMEANLLAQKPMALPTSPGGSDSISQPEVDPGVGLIPATPADDSDSGSSKVPYIPGSTPDKDMPQPGSDNLIPATPADPDNGIEIKPITPGNVLPVLYGLFEDYAGAGDLDNPYWERTDNKTHHTGASPGTWITVQAYGKDGTLYPACRESLQIPPQEEGKDCIDLEIFRNGQMYPENVNVGAPTNDLYAEVVTTPLNYSGELEFIWNTNSGTLSSGGQSGQELTTQNASDLVDLTGGTDGTNVSVYAVDPNDPTVSFPACADSFLMEEGGENICENLQLTNSNPDLGPLESTTLKANPVRNDGTEINTVRWSENGDGRFEIGPTSQTINNMFPGTCTTPPSTANQNFESPKECDYVYIAGPDGGDTFRVEAVPSDGVDECSYFYRVPTTPPPGQPYCVDLNIDPDMIRRGDRTNYTGEARFSDGNTYRVDVDWSGQNGTFSNGSTFERLTNVSSSGFSNYFNHSNEELGARVDVAVSNVYDPDVSDDFSRCKETIELPEKPGEDECTYLYLRWVYDDLVCIGTDHEGNFIWGINGDEEETDELCMEASRDDEIYVEAVGYEDVCSDEYSPEDTPPEYELEKWVSIKGEDGQYTRSIVTIPEDHTDVWYKLIFTPEGETTTTITDTISGGFIRAEILPIDAEGKPAPGIIQYDETLSIFEKGYGELNECSELELDEDEDEEPSHCYNGDLEDNDGIELVRVSDEVTITYEATIKSRLNPDNNEGDDICEDGIVCQEKYRNRATAYITYPEDLTIRSNDIIIQIFCQYILTQAAGDIFLERDLTSGVDIQQCSEITSSPGIVITPGVPKPPTAPSTGQGDTEIFTISHELCTSGLAGELPSSLQNIYGQDVIPSLSGQICEVKLPTGSAWKQSFITNSIDENKTRLSRWGADINNDVNIGLFNALNYTGQSVYHVKGGNLTISNEYVLNDGDGAKTYIIEDGDLIIKNNIKYGACPAGENCTVRDTASLAFIVLNGSVYVDPSVSEIAGVYFVQEGDDNLSGRFFSGAPGAYGQDSDKTLKVTGSIYGDIDPLFGNRKYAGDPTLGQGGIVIRFDERIILNTPPGLRDVLNLSATEVAR